MVYITRIFCINSMTLLADLSAQLGLTSLHIGIAHHLGYLIGTHRNGFATINTHTYIAIHSVACVIHSFSYNLYSVLNTTLIHCIITVSHLE